MGRWRKKSQMLGAVGIDRSGQQVPPGAPAGAQRGALSPQSDLPRPELQRTVGALRQAAVTKSEPTVTAARRCSRPSCSAVAQRADTSDAIAFGLFQCKERSSRSPSAFAGAAASAPQQSSPRAPRACRMRRTKVEGGRAAVSSLLDGRFPAARRGPGTVDDLQLWSRPRGHRSPCRTSE